MRSAHISLLIAFVAAAVMSIAASSTSAQVSIIDEATGEPCSAVVNGDHAITGGCYLEAESEAGLLTEYTGPFGVMFSCAWHFDARFDGNGEGWVYNQVITDADGDCGIDPCSEGGEETPWRAHLNTETSMETPFCVIGSFGIIANCHMTLNVNQISHTTGEVSTAGTTHVPCEAGNSWRGHWLIAAPDGIEII